MNEFLFHKTKNWCLLYIPGPDPVISLSNIRNNKNFLVQVLFYNLVKLVCINLWHILLIPALSRQRQVGLYEFKARLVFIVSFRTASTIYRNPVFSKQTIKLAHIRYEHQTRVTSVLSIILFLRLLGASERPRDCSAQH